MTDQSMRGFLASLEQSGDLQRVERQVDPRFELGVVLSLADRGPALWFERVGPGRMPVVGHILTSRERFARATAPYSTAGVIVAKDPETGRRNVSIARLRLAGGARLMAGIARNHHLYILAETAKALGRKLELAVAIGNHAAVLLASQMYVVLGD